MPPNLQASQIPPGDVSLGSESVLCPAALGSELLQPLHQALLTSQYVTLKTIYVAEACKLSPALLNMECDAGALSGSARVPRLLACEPALPGSPDHGPKRKVGPRISCW